MAGREKQKRANAPQGCGRMARRSPRRLLRGILYLLIGGGLMAVVVYSPLFTMQRLVLNGNTYLTQEDIMEIGRIEKGTPLFQLQTDAINQNLMHDLRIESAVVRRRLPDTMEIDITERMPVASVSCDYGYIDFDRQGKVLRSYRVLQKMPIPLITGITLHDLYIGDDNTNETVAQVLCFLQKLDAEALNQISEINIADPEAVKAYTTDAVQIRLGNMDRMEEKAMLTQEFLHALPNSRHPIEYVDFSYTAPVIRLKNMPQEPLENPEMNAQ